MAISRLASLVRLSPNHYNGRAYPITKITVHHMAGNLSVEQCGSVFASPVRQASSNYGVGTDGRIACYVDESNAAWTSSSWDNDNRAVTIEVANNDTSTWSSSEIAYNSTVLLVEDICRRNGIAKLVYTGDARGNLTEHRMFAATACPGPWWHARMAQFARDVNRRLESDGKDDDLKPVSNQGGPVRRLYNPNGFHHYTLDASEASRLVSKGWRDEGVAFNAPKGGTVAVYRLYNPGDGDHLLTTSFQEASERQADGWSYEGVPFFGVEDGIAVFRVYNPYSGEHFYTKDAAERDKLVAAGRRDEGVAFYAVA